jgi:hypothetical protein
MTPIERIRQNAEFVRRLHDAVHEPELRKKQQIQETRRRNRLEKLKQERSDGSEDED